MELNERQRKFINHYLKTSNVTQSALKAGYSPKTAESQGSRLLKNVKVRQEIKRRQKISDSKASMSLDQWREELTQIARASALKFMNVTPEGVSFKDGINDLPEDEKRLISEISEVITQGGGGHQKLKIKDSMKAYEMLGKHLGAYEKDNSQQSGPTFVIERPNGDKAKFGMGEDA